MLASKKQKVLRPASLAWYMAVSAFFSSRSALSPSRGATAIPSEAVASTSTPLDG